MGTGDTSRGRHQQEAQAPADATSAAENQFMGAAPKSSLCSVAAGAAGPAQARHLDGILGVLPVAMEQVSESCT